jgi:hypothetical protein
MKFLRRMARSKTFWVGVSAMCGSTGAFVAGEMELQPYIFAMVGSILAIFMRDGMERK